MKKLLFFLLLLPFLGCRSTKVVESKKEVHDFKADSLKVSHTIERNGPIAGNWHLYIGEARTGDKNCDSLCNEQIRDMLRSLNVNQSSGDNGFGVRFNELTRQLEIYTRIAGTSNERIEQLEKQIRDRKESEIVEVPVFLYPMWLMILAGIGAATIIYLLYRVIAWFYKQYRKLNPIAS